MRMVVQQSCPLCFIPSGSKMFSFRNSRYGFPDTCSMIVDVEDGRAVRVRGNQDHPFTRGGLCVKVDDYEQRVHHPDRILYPMRRTGPKGEGQFERIHWDEALSTISERWHSIIEESGSQAILPYSYLGHQGLVNVQAPCRIN